MKNLNHFVFFLGLLLISELTSSQENKTLSEQLGYARDAKLLIIHMNDMGMSNSVNMACMAAFKKNSKLSGSTMVPCPWFLEIAEFAKNHPELDIGIQLTLTSEWKYYKWGGIMPASEIPGLLTKEGYFYPTSEEMSRNARPDEVEKEAVAQIEKAIAYGIKPTHIAIPMGSTGENTELSQVYKKVSKEYNSPGVPMVGHYTMGDKQARSQNWYTTYEGFIENLKPGLSELIVHLAYNNDEMRAVTVWDKQWPIDSPNWGAAWREKDFVYICSDEFKNLLKKYDVHLVTWKEIQNCLKLSSGSK